MSYRVGSLFSGIGGFDLGFERAGFRIAWMCEREPFCRQVLAKRFPDVPCYDDVTTLRGADVEPVDVLVGGFPCQDVSVAGQRKGLSGERTGLFWEFMRLIEELHPSLVVLENVPGLLTSHRGRDFHTVLHALAERGLRRAYRILDSQHFGVAQRRRRVFIVGSARESGIDPAAILFESTGGERDSQAGREAGARVARGVADGARIAGTLGAEWWRNRGLGQENETDGLVPFDTTQITSAANRSHPRAGDPCHPLATGAHPPAIAATPRGRSNGPGVNMPGRGGEDDQNLICVDPTAGRDYTVYGDGSTPPLKVGSGIGMGWSPAIADVAAGERARALTASMHKRHDDDTDTLIPQSGVRRLTPAECEILQAFPMGWTCLCGEGQHGSAPCRCSDSPRYRALGNAVTVSVAQWIAERVMAELQRRATTRRTA